MEKQFIRKQIELIYRHNPRLFFPRCFVTILLAFFELKEKQYFQNFSIELGSQQGESFLFPVQSDICLNWVYNALHGRLIFVQIGL